MQTMQQFRASLMSERMFKANCMEASLQQNISGSHSHGGIWVDLRVDDQAEFYLDHEEEFLHSALSSCNSGTNTEVLWKA